ncbi:AfsR/SARP family transcriptional regulator [Allokutzneria multivorans]|uniref:AfsR/SARP family transcriptional regulator n=1 Tax=Allokutzneria multivorans TaxID=1142134 RepID=UPI0031EFF3D3
MGTWTHPPRYRLLGTLEVRAEDGWRVLRSGRQRTVLALLIVHANRFVSSSRLIDELWAQRPPNSAANALQVFVHQLRQFLGDGALATKPGGYLLSVADGDADTMRFESLVLAARAAVDRGEHRKALALVDDAVALWRSQPFSDVPEGEELAAEHVRLDELSWSARQYRADALLGTGKFAEAVGELRALTTEQPLNEGHWVRLMAALYGAGRQADALEAYRAAREILVSSLGVEPGEALRERHAQILAAVPIGEIVSVQSTSDGPAELPAGTTVLTGRERELERLAEVFSGPAPLAVVSGQAGIGKTALAVHFGHSIADRFPDGQLFVDLRGHGELPPMAPAEAMGRFLRALGVEPESVPADPDEASAALRSRLKGRRVLLVLDNAGDAEQVRPVLPGETGCGVLVTSRSSLGGLVALNEARPIAAGVLDAEQSVLLVRRIVGSALIDADPVAARELAEQCAGLPLALRVVSAHLLLHPGLDVAGMVARLRAGRLSELAIPGDPRAAVRSAFALSYYALPEAARVLFRRLSVIPGPTFGTDAAACLVESDVDGVLAVLVEAHLVEEPRPGRYRMHDLLREFAAELAAQVDDTGALRETLSLWYLHAVCAAVSAAMPGQLAAIELPSLTAAVKEPEFADAASANAWLGTEEENAVAVALAAGASELTWKIALALVPHLDRAKHFRARLEVAEAGLAAARALGDAHAESRMLSNLGLAHHGASRYDEATRYQRESLAVAEAAADERGQLVALGNLAMALEETGTLEEAEGCYRRSLAIAERRDEPGITALVLHNLGILLKLAKRYEESIEVLERAIGTWRELGNDWAEAMAQSIVGDSLDGLERHEEAMRAFALAEPTIREAGDPRGAARCVRGVGTALRRLGRYEESLEHLLRALAEFEESGEEYGIASTNVEIGHTLAELGRRAEAITRWRAALAWLEERGMPETESVRELLGA